MQRDASASAITTIERPVHLCTSAQVIQASSEAGSSACRPPLKHPPPAWPSCVLALPPWPAPGRYRPAVQAGVVHGQWRSQKFMTVYVICQKIQNQIQNIMDKKL